MDLDGAVEVDDLVADSRLALAVEAHRPDASPVTDLAVPDPHAFTIFYVNGPFVDVGALHNNVIQQHAAGSVYQKGRSRATVLQHSALRDRVADPARRAALGIDDDRVADTVRVQHDGPGHGNVALPGAEARERMLDAIHDDPALIVRVLFQPEDAAAVAALTLIEWQRVHGCPAEGAALSVLDPETGDWPVSIELHAARIESRTKSERIRARKEIFQEEDFHTGLEDKACAVGVTVLRRTGGIGLWAFHNAGADAYLVELAVDDVVPFERIPGLQGHLGILRPNPAVPDGVRDAGGKDGRAGAFLEGFPVEDVSPHTAPALQGLEAVNLALEIPQKPLEVRALRVETVEHAHGRPHNPAVAAAPVIAGAAAGFLIPAVVVEFVRRIPKVYVEVVDLADGIPQHQRITVMDGIPRHQVEAHIQVIGP